MDAGLGLIALILAVLAFAVVNSVEIAVVAVNRLRVRHLAETGSLRAKALLDLHEHQERFFAAIVFLQNVFSYGAALAGALVANDSFGALGGLAAFIVVPYVITQFGELTPKVLAAEAPEGFALAIALPASALTRVLGPIVWALGIIPRLLSRWVFGVRLGAGPSVTEAELRMLIGIGAETGSVEEAEAELLDRVFHFGDRRVHEVMVPRTEVVWLEADATVADFYRVFAQSPHSRFPVFEESPDHVVGVVGIKDVLHGIAEGRMTPESRVREVMRPPFFVPETKLVGELFREMQANRTQLAVAVDEFGGTAGIVTLEQLLEEMVGRVGDELRPPEVEIKPIDAETVQVDGSLSIEEAREELGLDIPEGDYDTIAGYVLSLLGHIPSEGESVPIDGHRIKVVEMRGAKIELLQVTRA
ncbi:MAG TPA: hemolysin family protein [Dehalococcoidia bacterium]|nr:hemolysin family protein [Dehalococcoidia bacterium]